MRQVLFFTHCFAAARSEKKMDSLQMSRYNPPLLKLISVISLVYFLYYLWWRITHTMNPNALLFSWGLFLAEAFGVFSYFLFAWMTRDISPLPSRIPSRDDLKVDIFVPTYNEDVDILEATLVGCRNVRYPHRTYLLDDGNRREVRDLADRLGAVYLARPTHEHAKAGNINYALKHTDSDFVAILDADMVPQPDYLDRTLGYFEDEQLALIQLPQEFYNQDSIQHSPDSPYWHEQALFFRVIQPGKNRSNSAFWCGSPSVVRRSALEEIGGVATETITEDIHTTVRLHSRGWKTLFVNEPLAYGIAPQTMEAFLLQRLRWAQGTMQLYRSKESPLWIRGLTWRQRLSYLSSFLAYFESFQKLILIFTPVLILTLGIFPMKVGISEFLIRWLPYFVLNILANQIGGRGVFQYFKTEKYNILKMIVFIESTFTLVWKKPLKFKVTPKSVDPSVYARETRALRLYMLITGVLAGSMLYGFAQIFSLSNWTLSYDAFFIALFWAGYNNFIILFALGEIFQKRHERKHYRFPVELSGKLYSEGDIYSSARVRVTDLSISGAGLVFERKILQDYRNGNLILSLPGLHEISLPVKDIHYQKANESQSIRAGVSLNDPKGIAREQLFEYLFVNLPRSTSHTYYQVMEWDPIQALRHILQRMFSALRLT